MKLIEFFLEMMAAERGSANNTLLSYQKDLKDFATYLKDHNKELALVMEEDLRSYLASLNAILSAASLARKISCLKQFYQFLHEENIITHNPTKKIELPKKTLSLPKFLTKEQMKHLLLVAKEGSDPADLRLYSMLELLYATGMRVEELVSLKYDCLQYDQGQMRPMLIINGKGNKERVVMMNHPAILAMLAYLAIRHLFVNEQNKIWLFASQKSYLSRQRFGQMLKSLALKANLNPQKISPHIIRHSFASHLLENGADLRAIQRLLGHTSINTTQIYTHVQLGKLQEVLDKFHPLSTEYKLRISDLS